MTELSELFKDTRIFLLHSRITWLANAGRCAAAAGGLGYRGVAPPHQLLAVQWDRRQEPAPPAPQLPGKLSATATACWRILVGAVGDRDGTWDLGCAIDNPSTGQSCRALEGDS